MKIYEEIGPDTHESLTYAYDMFGYERNLMDREYRRLEKLGADPVVVRWDARKHGDPVRVREDQVSNCRTVFGEIWVRRHEEDTAQKSK